MSQGSTHEYPGSLSGVPLLTPPLQTEEEQDALIQMREKGTGFVHRKQQLILPLRTDAQPQAVVLRHQAER